MFRNRKVCLDLGAVGVAEDEGIHLVGSADRMLLDMYRSCNHLRKSNKILWYSKDLKILTWCLGKVECSRVRDSTWRHSSIGIERSRHRWHKVVTIVRSWHALHLHRIWSAWNRSLALHDIWRRGTCWWSPCCFWKRVNSKLQIFALTRKFTMVTWEYWHGTSCLSRAFGCQILQ